MLTDVVDRKHRRNLYREGIENGYMIHDGDNVFQTRAFSNFTAGLLDVTNPQAVKWYKQIIKDQMLNYTGVYGFMADFGEAAPLSPINCSLYNQQVFLIRNIYILIKDITYRVSLNLSS